MQVRGLRLAGRGGSIEHNKTYVNLASFCQWAHTVRIPAYILGAVCVGDGVYRSGGVHISVTCYRCYRCYRLPLLPLLPRNPGIDHGLASDHDSDVLSTTTTSWAATMWAQRPRAGQVHVQSLS